MALSGKPEIGIEIGEEGIREHAARLSIGGLDLSTRGGSTVEW
ncbi:hypothetical protein [Halosimplex sp. TS25]